MSVNFEHYIILGIDIKNIENQDFIDLPYVQQYVKSYGDEYDHYIDFDDAMEKDLKKQNIIILNDGMDEEYCIIGVILMESSDSYDSGCFDDGMKPMEWQVIEEAMVKLLNSPLAPIINEKDIKIFAGTHFH